jgi:NitT/TauT family transport system ATP-binding protein
MMVPIGVQRPRDLCSREAEAQRIHLTGLPHDEVDRAFIVQVALFATA